MFKLPSFPNWLTKKRSCPHPCQELQIDEVEIEINGVRMKVKRRLSLSVPHEVTAIIPRVEIRRREYKNGEIVLEDEMILNSITIVHAPRHPLAGETPPQVEPKPEKVSPQTPKIKLNYRNYSAI